MALKTVTASLPVGSGVTSVAASVEMPVWSSGGQIAGGEYPLTVNLTGGVATISGSIPGAAVGDPAPPTCTLRLMYNGAANPTRVTQFLPIETSSGTINLNQRLAAGKPVVGGQYTPPGGGATTLDGLTDVDTSDVTNGQALTYDSASSTWKPSTVAAGGSGPAIDDTTASTTKVYSSNKVKSLTDALGTRIDNLPNNPGGGGGGSARYVESTLARTAGPAGPLALTWKLTGQKRGVTMLDSRFVEAYDGFEADFGLYTRLTATPSSNPIGAYNTGTATISSGKMVFTGAGTGAGSQFRLLGPRKLRAPYAVVIADVTAWSAATVNNIARVGLYCDANNYLEFSYDRSNGQATLVLVLDTAHGIIGGPVSNKLVDVTMNTTAPARMALRLEGYDASIWMDFGDGWVPLGVTTTSTLWNPYSEAIISQFAYGIGAFQPPGFSLTMGAWRAGWPGAIGYRVPILVTWDDNTPYRAPDGRIYVTLVTAGLPHTNAYSGDAGHTGIYLMDPVTYALEEVGKHIYRYQGNLAGYQGTQITVMRDTGEMIYLTTTFGGPAVTTLRNAVGRTGADVLHGVHLLDVTELPLPLPSGTTGHYDGWLHWDGTQWWCGTGINAGAGAVQAGLYQSAGADLMGTWTLIGRDTTTTQVVEACKLTRINGALYWTFAHLSYCRVYNYADLSYVGNLNWDSSPYNGAANIPPHGMWYPLVRSDGKTVWQMVSSADVPWPTAGGFESEGTLLILEAVELSNGWEAPYRVPTGPGPSAPGPVPALAAIR